MRINRPKPRVVIDTNIFVSALVFGGNPRRVTDLINKKSIIPVVSEEIMTELRRIMLTKFPLFTLKTEQLEQLLGKYAQWVRLGSVNVSISRDPDDDRIIETAILGKCTYIVSGDKDLLAIGSYEGIAILTPAEFLKIAAQNHSR